MAQEERYGTRDRTYSAWHRRRSTGRFVGIERAQTLAMIDLDASLYVEYDDGTKEPLALIETAEDVGQPWKPSTVTRKLAERCVPILPAFVVLYTKTTQANPADSNARDISMFRVRRIHPQEQRFFTSMTPAEWAERLMKLRDKSAALLDDVLGWRDTA